MAKTPKRPRDPNQLAKFIADLATGERAEPHTSTPSPMADLGQRGGLKGGNACAAKLSPEQRREIAKKAAAKRWAKP